MRTRSPLVMATALLAVMVISVSAPVISSDSTALTSPTYLMLVVPVPVCLYSLSPLRMLTPTVLAWAKRLLLLVIRRTVAVLAEYPVAKVHCSSLVLGKNVVTARSFTTAFAGSLIPLNARPNFLSLKSVLMKSPRVKETPAGICTTTELIPAVLVIRP